VKSDTFPYKVAKNLLLAKPFVHVCSELVLKGVAVIFFSREWKFNHPSGNGIQRKPYGLSIRNTKVGENSLFSRQILYTMVITNLLSLLLGTGIG